MTKEHGGETDVPLGSHLRLPEIIVDHSEVKAEVFHVTFIALEKKQVSVHLRVQRGQMVDVYVRTGA